MFEAIGAKDDLAGLTGDRRARSPLSERKIEVVRKVAAGLGNRAVAHQLHISEKTVASHLSHIFAKLDVANRAAVTALLQRGARGPSVGVPRGLRQDRHFYR